MTDPAISWRKIPITLIDLKRESRAETSTKLPDSLVQRPEEKGNGRISLIFPIPHLLAPTLCLRYKIF